MPKAIIRVYLTDGRWKAVVVEADQYTRQCIPLIASKLNLTGKENFSDYFLFESLDNGRVVNELPGTSKPFEISQKWGPKSGNVNRFVFKRRTDKLKLFDTAFESQWKSSLIEDKQEIPKQQNLLAATRTPNQNSNPSSPATSPPDTPRKEEQEPEPPKQEEQPAPETPRKKIPVGAQPLFFVGAKMVLPPPPKPKEDGSNTNQTITSPRQNNTQAVTVDHSEIQSQRTRLKEKQNEKQQKLDVHKQSILTWCNSILEKKNLSMKDLIQDLKSGVMLANILEICTGATVKHSQNPKLPAQKLDNLTSCLNLLKQHGVSAQGCTASDILNGNESAVVGLMFLVVNKFSNVSQVANNRFSVALTSQGGLVVGAPEPTPDTPAPKAEEKHQESDVSAQEKRQSYPKPLPTPQRSSKILSTEQTTQGAPPVPATPVVPQDPELPPVPAEPEQPPSEAPPAVPPAPEDNEDAPPVPPVPTEPDDEILEEPEMPPVPPVPSQQEQAPELPPVPQDNQDLVAPELPPVPDIPAEEEEELPPPVPPVPVEDVYMPEVAVPLPPIIEPQRSPSISKDCVPEIPPPIISPSIEEVPPPVPPEPEAALIDAQFEELNDFLTELAHELGVSNE